MIGGTVMPRMKYNALQIEQLEKNPNVLHVSEYKITYHPDFQVKAVKENLKGKGPAHIFIDNGFDLTLIGKEKPKDNLRRWREMYRRYGEEGFYVERRGKFSTGRPTSKQLSSEEKLKKAETRIKFLEAENEFLKKLEAIERQVTKKER